MRTALIVLVAAILSLLGCATASGDAGGSVPDFLTLTGSVALRQPVTLPSDALLTVTLEDVSRADAPAVTLAQTQTTLHGQQAPIGFSLVYPGPAVQPGAIYAARARLTLGDQLLYTTTEHNRVDALNPAPLTLVMDAVPAAAQPPKPDASLTDTYWKLTEVNGQPIKVVDGMREPNLVLQSQESRFAGSGGVNRLMGGYTLDGDSLTFSNAASTMMAGPPDAMAQEQVIAQALPSVRGFAIAGDQLTLLGDAGQPVFKAVAVALQ
jgi:putative lipoprotein